MTTVFSCLLLSMFIAPTINDTNAQHMPGPSVERLYYWEDYAGTGEPYAHCAGMPWVCIWGFNYMQKTMEHTEYTEEESYLGKGFSVPSVNWVVNYITKRPRNKRNTRKM